MPQPDITLFTSIPPRVKRPVQGQDFGPAWQAACLDSWIKADFRIVSLNTPNEIDAIRPIAPTVEFREIPASRQRPLITDFFSAASNFKNSVVGIINADCMLIAQTQLKKRLSGHTDGLVIVERLNISELTLRPTGLSCSGFDAFFFDPASLADIERDDYWHIGGVWVDYWLPFAFHAAGLEIKTLPGPMLLHLNHDLAWGWEAWNNEIYRVTDLLCRAESCGRLDPALAAGLHKAMRKNDVGTLQKLFFLWLKSQKPLWTPDAGSVDDLTMKAINASAIFPQTYTHVLAHQFRDLKRRIRGQLRRIFDALGLRRALYTIWRRCS
jgi:hypothetical protein